MAFKIAVFTLNQWALDFKGNISRIKKSIQEAHHAGAIYRLGPELEICGYSLEDAFFESDTIEHCWQCLKEILDDSKGSDMILDVGMPVSFGSAIYNCRVICHKGKVVCIRAKSSLAREGNYRESRYFKAWAKQMGVTSYRLPNFIQGSQQYVPIGCDLILDVVGDHDTSKISLRIGWEICQELWDNKNVSSNLYEDFGCHLVVNSSASYWQLRKLGLMNDMIKGISLRGGACYAYSNLVGCDGQRYVFSGRSCIYNHGELVAITKEGLGVFEEVQMISHIIYPEKIDEQRAQSGVHLQPLGLNGNTNQSKVVEIFLDLSSMRTPTSNTPGNTNLNLDPGIMFEEEIYFYVTLWLWDYLRRSRMKGFMMPLSGGLDSSTVAVLVYSLCNNLYQLRSLASVKTYFANTHQIDSETFESSEKICAILLKCRYLATQYSGQDTLNRANDLGTAMGANIDCVSIQNLYTEARSLLKRKPGGEVDLIDQNLQARLRMAMTYALSEGNRIVLATGNVDEGIMGYLTKYDCSSADINPIGGLCKSDLKSFLRFCCSDKYQSKQELVNTLQDIIAAPPSAELTGSEQRDEDEIGITYDEISVLGRVRRGAYGCSGPSSAFKTLWRNRRSEPFCSKVRCLIPTEAKTPGQIAIDLADLVKRFYQRYTRNRHKLTVLTPALHAETYSPDDNRFDHRQFLYPSLEMQFQTVDSMVAKIEQLGDIDAQQPIQLLVRQ